MTAHTHQTAPDTVRRSQRNPLRLSPLRQGRRRPYRLQPALRGTMDYWDPAVTDACSRP